MCLFLAGEEASGGGSLAHCVREMVKVTASVNPTPLSLHKRVSRGLRLENFYRPKTV